MHAGLSSESTREKFAEIIESTLKEAAEFANKHGKHDSVNKLDEIACSIAEEIARLKAADRVISEADAEDRDRVAEKISKTTFAQQEAHQKRKECIPRKYKDFRRSVAAREPGEEDDNDEPVIASQAVNEKDPLTCLPLQEESGGKWPVALQCGHVYNYSTVMGKRNGGWTLAQCVVSGCNASTISNRSSLKEDGEVKRHLIRSRHLGSQSAASEIMEIDDLE